MSNYTQKASDLTGRIVSWANSDGSLGGLRRLMIGNGRWTGNRDITISIQRHTDELRIRFSETEIRIPKEGYSYTQAQQTVSLLRGRISSQWNEPITGDEVTKQVHLLQRAWRI